MHHQDEVLYLVQMMPCLGQPAPLKFLEMTSLGELFQKQRDILVQEA